MLMWVAGLKPFELCALRADDIDRRTNTVNPTGREDEIVVPKGQRDELWECLRRWRRHRKPIATAKSPLLCNLSGGKLDTSYFRHALASLSDEAGVSRRFHAQGLRNTFAAAHHFARIPAEIIRRQLGLGDLEYTVLFLARIAPIEQVEAMDDFSLE